MNRTLIALLNSDRLVASFTPAPHATLRAVTCHLYQPDKFAQAKKGQSAVVLAPLPCIEDTMYERHHQPLASRRHFIRRFALHVLAALLVLGLSLGIGMLGYRTFEHLSWIDAFLNSAMLLGGMGPVNSPLTAAGKLFAGIYALYAGLVFLITAGLAFTPLVHRLLHRFHLEEKDQA